jgi:peptidoglycan/xylan/chitin deacetylase (PgdA/CDA1 family)
MLSLKLLILAALSAANHSASPGLAVLCYHDIQAVAKNDMTTTPALFEQHLKWLKEHGYRTLSMDDLVSMMKKQEPAPEKAVALTFDDGYEGVYKYAYPLLRKYGFRATLFLVTSKAGDSTGSMPHLTWPQIEEMDRTNIIRCEVHAAAMHVKLGLRVMEESSRGVEPKDVEQDLKAARDAIEQHTHRRASFIAWPFGNYNKQLIHIATKDGFYAMLNTEYGVNHPGDKVSTIKRLRMSSANDTLSRFESKLAKYGLR